MSLPSLSIRRHVFAAMLSIVLVLFGLIGYQRIGVDRYPQVEFPLVSVVTVLPGANPDIVDTSVTGVIESAVNAIPGIDFVASTSQPGVSQVILQFDLSKNIDVAFNEAQRHRHPAAPAGRSRSAGGGQGRVRGRSGAVAVAAG